MTDESDKNRRWALAGGGLAAGVAIGIGLGVALDNIAVGIALGVALGVALGSGSQMYKEKPDDEAPKDSDPT